MFPQLAIGALKARKIFTITGSQTSKTAKQNGAVFEVFVGTVGGSQSSKLAQQSGQVDIVNVGTVGGSQSSKLAQQSGQVDIVNLNEKIIAYWKFDGTENRVYDGFSSADFIIDEVSDPTLDLALQTTVATFDSGGIISNCLPVFGEARLSTAYNNVLAALNPVTNGFEFIGIGMWINIKDNLALDYDFTGTTYESLICDFGNRIVVKVKVISNDPFEYQIEFINGFIGYYAGIQFGVPSETWLFMRFEVNRAALTFTMKLTDYASSTFAYSETNTTLTYATIGSSDTVEFLIDESFAYSAPLTSGEFTQVYNSGSGNTYPF